MRPRSASGTHLFLAPKVDLLPLCYLLVFFLCSWAFFVRTFAAAFDAFAAIPSAVFGGRGHFRERFAVARPTRFGAFLSLIAAVTVPSLISNSPWQDGHFRREETITLYRRVDDLLFAEWAGKGMVEEIELDGSHGSKW